MKFKDLSGLKFERLLVIEFAGRNERGNILWRCLCDCGKERVVIATSLTSGNTKSCGCFQRDRVSETNFRDITGNRFGKLIAVKVFGKDNFRGYVWECLCDCGKTTFVAQHCLYAENTRSCGCSGKESKIAQELKKYFFEKYNSISEYSVFVNPKTGFHLSFDIYIPIKNIFIEVMGSQHYGFVKYWHKNKKGFEYSKYKDEIKKKYAEENGFYIEIDLRKIKTTKFAIDIIESFIERL